MPDPLAQCIERERALVQPYATATTAKKIMRIGEEMKAARAATDEAVRAVEAEARELRGTLRNLRWHLTGRYENELVKMINDVIPPDDATPAPTAQGESTGGASDEH